MQIHSLSFGRTPDTPPVVAGMAIALEPPAVTASRSPQPRGQMILGACRVSAEVGGEDGIEVARAIFLTAAGGSGPNVFTTNLVGERLVYEQDVQRLGDDWICAFRCELDVSTVLPGSFLLHGSLFNAISNSLWVVR
jgi:hypothetical protein